MSRRAQDSLAVNGRGRSGLVMVCDVDISVSDATRTHTIEVAENFAREGLEVELIARGSADGLRSVRLRRADGASSGKVGRVVHLNRTSLFALIELRRKARLCYVRHNWSTTPVVVAARLLGYRVVTQVDDLPFGRDFRGQISFVADYAKRACTVVMGRFAHGIVAVTPQIRDLLVHEFHVPAERVAVLPNGVDVERFTLVSPSEAAQTAGLDGDLRYVVFCGHFAPWVDFDLLLRAFAEVHRGHPDTRLLLIGDGSERSRVESLLKELGLQDAAILTGFIDDPARVASLISCAAVAVMSHRDDYVGRIGVSPTKLAEYFAAGRPVVARDVPGIREAIERTGAGRAVAARPQAMAAAIGELLDPTLAATLGARGRAAAEEHYTWRSVVRRTLPLFANSST